MKTKNILGQFLRQQLAGLFIVGAEYLALFLLTDFCGLHYLISNSFAFALSVLLNYLLGAGYVFRSHSACLSRKQELLVFLFLSVVRYLGSQLILWVCAELLGLHYMLGKLVTMLFSAIYNFVTQKLLFESGRS